MFFSGIILNETKMLRWVEIFVSRESGGQLSNYKCLKEHRALWSHLIICASQPSEL